MKFDLSIEFDSKKFKERIKYLEKKGLKVELNALRDLRTIKQNSYLHVVISLYCVNFGSTINEAKTDLKRGCHFMKYQKNNNWYLKETSKMDSKELTDFIDWIRNYASQQGCYIPTSEEYLEQKMSIDNEIERHKQYL